MPNDDNITASGISRRSVIKKGAIAGGALVWATPVVQTLGQGIAGAQVRGEGSPRCEPGGQQADVFDISSSSAGSSQQKTLTTVVIPDCGDCPVPEPVISWSVVAATANIDYTSPGQGQQGDDPASFKFFITTCQAGTSITVKVRVEVTCADGECQFEERTEKFDYNASCQLSSPVTGTLISETSGSC